MQTAFARELVQCGATCCKPLPPLPFSPKWGMQMFNPWDRLLQRMDSKRSVAIAVQPIEGARLREVSSGEAAGLVPFKTSLGRKARILG